VEIWLAIVAAIPPTLTGVAAIIVALGNRARQKRMHQENQGAFGSLDKIMRAHVRDSRREARRKGKR